MKEDFLHQREAAAILLIIDFQISSDLCHIFLLSCKIRSSCHIIGRYLIYIVIQPVGIQIVGMSSPQKEGLIFCVIVGIIGFWHIDRQPLAQISLIFLVQGYPVVFR